MTQHAPDVLDGPVDIHAHAMPRSVLEFLARRGLAELDGLDSGIVRIAPSVSGLPAGSPIPCPPEMLDVERRLAAMDEMGIAVAAISAPPFLFASAADDALAADVVTASNDALAGWVAQAGERLVGLGTVPVGRRAAAAEARRCVRELGFSGLAIGSAGARRELDDAVNEELWEWLAREQRFTLLHPSGTSSPARLRDFHLIQLLGYPAETALAVARLAFGGVLERHSLRVCLAHGGGCTPSLWGRLDLGWRQKQVCRTIASPPSQLLLRLFYDTVVFEPRQLARLVADVGATNVLLGTDFPFDLSDRTPLASLESAGLGAHEQDLIREGNARRLLFGGARQREAMAGSEAERGDDLH